MNKRLGLLALAAVLFLAFLAGCQKSGDDDDDNDQNDNGPFRATNIAFTPAGEAASGDIWLELETTDLANNAFTLRLMADGQSGVYGIAGRLTFDPEIAALVSVAAKQALAAEGVTVTAEAAANESGGVFGVTRTGKAAGAAVFTEPVVIGHLEFTVAKAGTTEISFTENRSRIMNPDLDEIEVTNWRGGTLTVK